MNNYPSNLEPKSEFKSGFVAIIGRPNVGKSTFLNQILGHKVVIVTPKSQTTRNLIRGIYTTDDCQIIFVDTPGIHKAHNDLGAVMNESAFGAMSGMDLILYFIDATSAVGDADLVIIDALNKLKTPIMLVANKVDLVKDYQTLTDNLETYKQSLSLVGGITICAQNGQGLNELITKITEVLPNGPHYYPEDQLLDQPERFVVAEIIREKILLKTDEEVPHSVAVVVESFKPHPGRSDMVDILATIVVERQSQKKIIIGAQGQKIKEIGTLARHDITKFLGSKVYLELFVKVETNWRNNKSRLREYGYRNIQ